MIVLDANVILSLFLPDEDAPRIRKALRKERAVVPPLWRSELISTLFWGYIREDRLSRDDALKVLERAEKYLSGHEAWPDFTKVVELCDLHAAKPKKQHLSTYDAEYVTLAAMGNGAVLTNDVRTLADRVPQHLVLRVTSLPR